MEGWLYRYTVSPFARGLQGRLSEIGAEEHAELPVTIFDRRTILVDGIFAIFVFRCFGFLTGDEDALASLQETNMAKTELPFEGMSDMVQQSFEQTRKVMENFFDLFQKSITASPWFASSDLNKKMQSYMEQNIAAASDFTKKLTQAKDFSEFLKIQSEFMTAQWKVFGEQTKELGETVTKGAASNDG